jgi:hypothetical protein
VADRPRLEYEEENQRNRGANDPDRVHNQTTARTAKIQIVAANTAKYISSVIATKSQRTYQF